MAHGGERALDRVRSAQVRAPGAACASPMLDWAARLPSSSRSDCLCSPFGSSPRYERHSPICADLPELRRRQGRDHADRRVPVLLTNARLARRCSSPSKAIAACFAPTGRCHVRRSKKARTTTAAGRSRALPPCRPTLGPPLGRRTMGAHGRLISIPWILRQIHLVPEKAVSNKPRFVRRALAAATRSRGRGLLLSVLEPQRKKSSAALSCGRVPSEPCA